ncbi:MAG TPA: hypothetical protein VMR50_15755 [Myxococcota bacterium]|nr:hypothetical protein [Myxococcota bacterium]
MNRTGMMVWKVTSMTDSLSEVIPVPESKLLTPWNWPLPERPSVVMTLSWLALPKELESELWKLALFGSADALDGPETTDRSDERISGPACE